MSIPFTEKKLSSFQTVILGFMGVILAGALLLMLPISAKNGNWSSFEDALFTSTSAVCVTGLVVRDTALHWSAFGQAVILILIQVGGLGIISFAAFIAMISGRRLSIFERSMLQDSISAHQIGGIVKMLRFVFKTTVILESAGALLLLPAFCRQYGLRGIWMSVFHSVSAFCNAGFDIMGDKTGAFSSLTSFSASAGVVIPICLLIVMGGIGFLTWDDIAANKYHIHRYRMQSKVIIAATAILIAVPTFLLFVSEYTGYPAGERFFLSLFQAVTPRTTGFNTADLNALSGSGKILIIMLMIIGGSPGSTAGGIKTTTVTVLFANAMSVFRRKKQVELFGRRVEDSAVKNAATLLMLYLFLTLTGAAAISGLDHLAIGPCVFEAASAIGTVGLSLGITPSLGPASHMVLIMLMFLGRVGGLTLIYAAVNSKSTELSQRPVEKIMVG